MPEFCASPAERARKAYSRVLQRLQEPGKQAALATVMGVSESTVSRLKNEHAEQVLLLLYALGFKLVSQEKVCVDGDELRVFRRAFARQVALEDEASRLFEEE